MAIHDDPGEKLPFWMKRVDVAVDGKTGSEQRRVFKWYLVTVPVLAFVVLSVSFRLASNQWDRQKRVDTLNAGCLATIDKALPAFNAKYPHIEAKATGVSVSLAKLHAGSDRGSCAVSMEFRVGGRTLGEEIWGVTDVGGVLEITSSSFMGDEVDLRGN
ncbi:hypothetical protein E2P84_42335 [Burkholderia cepacia]|uniref:Uncharacterized protein n=1 Tax=Burkholderia cepacia TaxID=292 RepID=A0AAX2RBA6_BURCE|nr:hypothetical protein [Burkholderia cepacia]TES62232.1 hypothetical protein E2P84_42335 [Burkholderia cepacia]TES95525.1 hypothetical protein E3D36_38305 [Burkholderia cepacia]TEU31454.1 hypothetical protein E3D37_44935 [Burkholderia cepacia]TEU33781.1 hypothetical protein E3D38_44090 [Burkholderia cepacia]TEU83137.1 hypothetical protein E3D40_44735 [Burkholderia cepacia]